MRKIFYFFFVNIFTIGILSNKGIRLTEKINPEEIYTGTKGIFDDTEKLKINQIDENKNTCNKPTDCLKYLYDKGINYFIKNSKN